ncbi:MAG: DoxX family protein [Prevotella sp.]|nr:DoxX family protein [Prevotella sp.]
MSVIVNICRFVVALTFIFSGFVKAIDPLGTQYKIEDYIKAAGLGDVIYSQWLTLGASVFLSAVEFCTGVLLLFAIHRRIVSKVAVVFMAVMTAVTLWLWIANPISDCGCFGDAIHLSNGQTLLKNIVLLACAAVIAWKPLRMMRFISKSNQWIVMNYTVLFILASSIWSLYDLPLFDFRPYHVGANIPQGMEIPEGEKQPEFETTFIMEKDGEQKEFTLDEYPDSTWTFIDSKTRQVSEGYVSPIHDFSIVRTTDGEDITEEVLSREGYTFLLISPHLEQASDSNFGEIDQIAEYAQEHGYPFYCLTASNEDAIERWREITGAEYEFCTTDETTLKTIIRSNPGLLLLRNGTVIRKWSHNLLPAMDAETAAMPMEKLPIGKMPEDSVPRKIALILMWFALPLFLLTLADRLWAWTKWLKKK